MFCENCGREMREGAEFCTSCGARRPQNAGSGGGNMTAYSQYPSGNNASHYNGVPQNQRRETQNSSNNAGYYTNNSQYVRSSRDDGYRDRAMRAGAPHIGVSFSEAIRLFFKNYANFNGRASRSEFWWVILAEVIFFTVLDTILMICMAGVTEQQVNSAAFYLTGIIGILMTLAILALLVPHLALIVRRLHDTGKAWYWLFMAFIPAAGFVIMIVFYCSDSDADNQWGYGPRRRYRDMNR